jgi:Tfp pilus assembly protein FimV
VEEFLEIFDQSRTMPGNTHYLLLDNEENKPAGYETVVRQLAGAAADKETKKVMDIEDEYAADIEDRIELEDIVQEQKEQLSQQKEQIEQQNNQLASLAKMLMSMGWSEKKIAEKTNMSIEQVKDIVN